MVAAFERSGLSGQAFARQQGIHHTTLYQWRRRYPAAPPSPAFVQVEMTSRSATAELVLEVGPARLRLHCPAQVPLAARLLQTLAAHPPC